MKKRLVSVMLVLTFLFSQTGMPGVHAEATSDRPDVLHGIFGGIDDISPDEKALDLPYLDGTVLSDVREPLYISDGKSNIYGESSFASDNASWKSSAQFTLDSGTVSINGTKYDIGSEWKLLNAAEGDFDNDGKKNELALLAAAKTKDNKALLLLCTATASNGAMSPIAVLYSGTALFYDNTREFANCMEIVCADVNGDGYDEIVTATPTSGYGTPGTDEYTFDKFGGAYLWTRTDTKSQNIADGWAMTPSSLFTGLNSSYGDNCALGTPGTTASIAAGDVDGDGYDDLVTVFSTTKAQYNANYSSNLFSVYYIGGAPTVDEMILKRNALMKYISGDTKKDLYLGVSSGDAAGFDAEICDIDGSGKPTIFLSFKQTVHSWKAMSGDNMYTPSFYIYSFDMKQDFNNFNASLVYHGGIYHHGWMVGDNASVVDTDYVHRTDPIDCAPVRIGVLKGDFGLSNGKKGYVSSGTIVADQRFFSFVRYPEGDIYRYEIANEGSYTGSWGKHRDENGHGFADDDCVFYRNGINVTDIKTANIRFDGTAYEDAALVSAYTDDGFRVYHISKNANGYAASALSDTDTTYGAVAMPDTDNDSIYLKYNKHQFFWADPVIIAALASPPYFDSLPSDMYSNSQTTYGKSLTSSSGKSESYTVSAGSYVSTEVKAGGLGTSGVFEAESEVMKSSTLEKEDTTEISYTQSFSASGGSDTVVLSTVAYDAYAYTAYYPGPNGEPAQSPYIVYIPHGGSDSIKIASMNYDDYAEFAKYADGALPSLDDVFTHTVGKPETYPHAAPAGANVLSGSILTHNKLAGFPTDTSSQTLSIDITNETSETTAAGSSVSVKLGGGVEAEADDIFGMANFGSKITIGSSSEKEYESGKIKTTAVGTSIEGTVFGQGDGMNTSGGDEKAYFNWRLLHYIHNFRDGDSVQQFPVVTYITSGVVRPKGVVPTALSVSPIEMNVEQVGPKTKGYVNEVGFTAKIDGVTREAYTALEGAPLGMTLNTGDGNIGTSGSYPFGIKINSNVKPGKYELCLNVGGIRSNSFFVTVDEYTDPVWLEADRGEVDFGDMRYRYSGGTPSVDPQTVTISNIYTEQINNLTAELDEDSDFEITEDLSSKLLYAKGLANSSATVKIAPKKGLDVGTHTGTLKISNGVTSAFVSLKYTVTPPVAPGAPSFDFSVAETPNPAKVTVNAPDDDGGGKMTAYLYTIQGHESYVENGAQIWKCSYNTAQSGSSFMLFIPDELTIGEEYTIGVKAKTTVGESEAAWCRIRISEPPNQPDKVQNIKVYPSADSITLTWDPISYWGENEYHPVIYGRSYKVYYKKIGDTTAYSVSIDYDDELQYTINGLESGKEYEISVAASAWDAETEGDTITVIPSSEVTPPSRPSAFNANMSYKTAELSWEAPKYTGGETVTYQVSNDGGNNWIDVGGKLSHTFDNLTTNREYDFRVRAQNSAGFGDSAIQIQTAPSNLKAPSEYTCDIERGYEQIEVAWEAIDDPSVTGYEVKLDDGEWCKIEPIKFDGKLHYIFSGLENDRQYALHVRGTNNEGGGNELLQRRKPSSLAPLPPKNARVEPRNGGIDFYGETNSQSDILEYKTEGGNWWSFSNYDRLNGFENGKEYTVAIATRGKDENGLTLRTRVYFTVTPDEKIPDAPSSPEISAYVGDDYIRFEWSVENDGGAAIEQYEVSINDDDPITLPASENSFLVNRSDLSEDYIHISVSAINSAGSSSNGIYAQLNRRLEGTGNVSLPCGRSEDFVAKYSLVSYHTYTDDDGKETTEEYDVSEQAVWQLTSNNSSITWNDEAKNIVVNKDIKDGTYTVILTANYYRTTYEKQITITVCKTASIVSAEKMKGGISVEMDMPAELGEKTLIVALYGSDGKPADVAMLKISNSSLSNGKIFVPVDTSKSVSAKIMLIDGTQSVHPICKSKFVEFSK